MRFLIFFMTVLGSSLLYGNDWPQFRGPDGNGIIEKIEHPLNWSDEKNIAWKVNLDGGGLSTPIVIGNKIFISYVVGADLPLNFAGGVSNMRPQKPGGNIEFCLASYDLKSGKELWKSTLADEAPKHPIHSSNSFATESPTSDGKHVFVYFASIGKVFAIDLEGNQAWSKDIGSFPTGNGFGPGSSITCSEGNVYVQCDNDRESFLIALASESGVTKWKKTRTGRTSWSTPILWKNNERTELIACGSGYVTSYNPQTGDTNWQLKGVSSAFSASPAFNDTLLFFGNSGPRSSGPLVAVDAQMSGEKQLEPGKSAGSVAWSKLRSGPGMSSPVVADGYLYIPSRGIISCYDAATGKLVYKERLPLKSTAASMWGGSGVVFLMDETGKCLALKTGPEMKILATNQIRDQFWSSAAVSGKSLLLRGRKTLYCIRQ